MKIQNIDSLLVASLLFTAAIVAPAFIIRGG